MPLPNETATFTSLVLLLLVGLDSSCRKKDHRPTQQSSLQTIQPDSLKITDPNFLYWCVQDIHPNKVSLFYLAIDRHFQQNAPKYPTTPRLIKKTYAQLASHFEIKDRLIKHAKVNYSQAEINCPPRIEALKILDRARLDLHENRFTQKHVNQYSLELAQLLITLSERQEHQKLYVSVLLPEKVQLDSAIEASNCLLFWYLGMQPPRA